MANGNLYLQGFAAETGMFFDKKRNSVYGHYNGYAMVVYYMQDQVQFMVTMDINGGTPEQANYISEFLRGLPQQKKYVKFAKFDENEISIGIKANKRDCVANLKEVIDSVTMLCRSNSMVSCCSICGSPNNLSVISVNGSCSIMCDDCFEKSKAELANAQIQVKKSKGNLLSGIVGAFLGSLIGVVAWIIFYQIGRYEFVAALVLAVCTIKGYQKFGGKLNIGGIVVSLLIASGMLYFANDASVAVQFCISDGTNFFDEIRNISTTLAYGDNLNRHIYNLVIGYILLFIAAISTYISIYKTANFRHELTRLELR